MSRHIDVDELVSNLKKLENEYSYADGSDKYAFVYGALTGVRQAIIYAKAAPTVDAQMSEIVGLQAFKEYFDGLYGQGLEVANWHLNGATEPFDEFYESALAEYTDATDINAGSKSEWISVKDRLPEEHMDVLIYHGGFIGDMMSVYTYIGNNEWRDEHGYRSTTEDEGITHWTPLPEPPKE